MFSLKSQAGGIAVSYPLTRVGSRWRCVSGGRRRGDRISIGKARRIAVKMALERMNTELARSRVQLGDPA